MIKSCQALLVFIAAQFHDTHVDSNFKGAASFENLILDLCSSDSFKAVTNTLRELPDYLAFPESYPAVRFRFR